MGGGQDCETVCNVQDSPQQRIICSKLSIVVRLSNPGLEKILLFSLHWNNLLALYSSTPDLPSFLLRGIKLSLLFTTSPIPDPTLPLTWIRNSLISFHLRPHLSPKCFSLLSPVLYCSLLYIQTSIHPLKLSLDTTSSRKTSLPQLPRGLT